MIDDARRHAPRRPRRLGGQGLVGLRAQEGEARAGFAAVARGEEQLPKPEPVPQDHPVVGNRRAVLGEGAGQARAGAFVTDYAIDRVIADLDGE